MTNDGHPIDGVWIEAQPFVGASAKTLRAAEAAAVRAGATGWVVDAGDWDAPLSTRWTELPVRVDLRADGSSTEVARVVDLGADLVGVPFAGARAAELVRLAAARDAECVLTVQWADGPLAGAARALALESESVVAVSLDRADEEALDALRADESLGAFVPGLQVASGYRRGAGAVDRDLGLLAPGGAARLLALCDSDVAAALEVERRLQRFAETRLAPAARRAEAAGVGRASLLAAVGDWCPGLAVPGLDDAGIDPDELRAELAEACPELVLGGDP
ncbi:MAG: hypothetical protein AAGA20_16255 [Planctomycetota bacterium]